MINQIQEHFKEKGYVVIKKFLDENTSSLLYRYCINKVKQVDFKTTYDKDFYQESYDGRFGDAQISGSYNCYGDVIMDTLLEASLNDMNNFTGVELIPTYSYWRFYQTGDILEKHKDRESCEISTTLCLGYNCSNIKEQTHNWPMYIKHNNNEIPVHMEPGDMIIYRGCDIEHWREPFEGLNHAQVFMHYNDKKGPYNIQFDGRPALGLPSKFSIRK